MDDAFCKSDAEKAQNGTVELGAFLLPVIWLDYTEYLECTMYYMRTI